MSKFLKEKVMVEKMAVKKDRSFKKFISQGINSGKSEEISVKNLDDWMTDIIDNVDRSCN